MARPDDPPVPAAADDGGSQGSAAVVFVAHGSRHEPANAAHRAVAEALAATLGSPVVAAFLELAAPDIGTGIDDAVASGARRVLVVPHFLYPGRHVTTDVPAIVDDARSRHPAVAIELAAPTGDDPALTALVADGVRRALTS